MIIRIVTLLFLLSCYLPSVASSSYQLKKPRASVNIRGSPSCVRKLIEIKRHSDGNYLVEVAVKEWESFFHQYGLKAIGSGEREGITSQLQF